MTKYKPSFSKEDLVKILKEVNLEIGSIPKRKDVPKSINAACIEVFGDWHNAIIETFGINSVQSVRIRREHGLCMDCGATPEIQGKWYCNKCAERHNIQKNEKRKERIEKRQCRDCGANLDEDDKRLCKKCFEIHKNSIGKRINFNKELKIEIKNLLQDILNQQENLEKNIGQRIKAILEKI